MANSELIFIFQTVKKNQISKQIKLLNDKKVGQLTDIPTKLIKNSVISFPNLYTKALNTVKFCSRIQGN